MNIFKFFGCILLIISCMIGGGILALPIITYEFGLTTSYIIMSFAYIIMLISGLLTLEICLKLPSYKNNFASIAEHIFGKPGKYFIILVLIIVIYSVITAYISASPSIFTNTFLYNTNLAHQNVILSFIFTISLGLIIVCGIKYAEILNRFIMGVKLITLFGVVILLLIKIPEISGFKAKSFANFSEGFSIILFVFSYQTIIPSLSNYIGKNYAKYTRIVIITAVTITFIISMLWITAIVSIIQPYKATIHSHLNLDQLLKILSYYNFGNFTNFSLKIFFNITIVSSFIALSVAFIDIWVDILKLEYNFFNRAIAGIIIYLPCWIIANLNSDIFIKASALSGYCGLFIALLLPSLVSYRLYKNYDTQLFRLRKIISLIMIFISIAILASIYLNF